MKSENKLSSNFVRRPFHQGANTCLNYGAGFFALQMNLIELQLSYSNCGSIEVQYLNYSKIAAALLALRFNGGCISALQCGFLHCSQRNLKNSHFNSGRNC
jgi:hypothetical protein